MESADVRGPAWTDDDVEQVAQASMRDECLPMEIMRRLGPNPGAAFFYALGGRCWELRHAQYVLAAPRLSPGKPQ